MRFSHIDLVRLRSGDVVKKAGDVTVNCVPDNVTRQLWRQHVKNISYLIDIDFINGDIRSWSYKKTIPDSKVHGANMVKTGVLSAPDGPHVGPMNLATLGYMCKRIMSIHESGWLNRNKTRLQNLAHIMWDTLWPKNQCYRSHDAGFERIMKTCIALVGANTFSNE